MRLALSPAAPTWRSTPSLALRGLRTWTGRQVLVALAGAIVFGGLLGMATVLIPNSLFSRDIPPVWWNYPVWVLTSIVTGMLVATYVSSPGGSATTSDQEDPAERRSGRFGIIGGMLAWFAVGCPVCNKIALLALGYSGAITWFAPVQPLLAVGALMLTGVSLAWRLRGLVACPLPTRSGSAVRERTAAG